MTPRALHINPRDAASRKLAVSALAASLLLGSPALAEGAPVRPGSTSTAASPLTQGIAEMSAMPGGEWRVVRREGQEASAAGPLYFVSGNGRWVVRGEVYDLWAGRALASFEDVRASTKTVAFDGLARVWPDLAPVEVGRGPAELVMFSDPNCPYCRALLGELEKRGSRVAVKVLEIPLLGGRSGEDVRRVHCAGDAGAAREAVLGRGFRDALAQGSSCDLGALQRRLVTAQMLGVRAVPFLIDARDGRFVEGMPEDLDAWLEAGS
jgi:thiol:disulfide interchange protein DsbC